MMQREKLARLAMLVAALCLGLAALAAGQGESKKVPQRSEIADKYKWRLSDIYATDAAWEKDYTTLNNNLGRFDQYKGKLGESASTLIDCLKLRDSLGLISDNLYVYAGLALDQDNRESKYQEMADRAGSVNSKLSSATSFIEPELLAMPGEQIQSYLQKYPELDPYRFYLQNLLRTKAHILSDKEESLLSLAGPVLGAPSRIFNMINDADISYGSIKDEDGNEVELTKERYSAMLDSPDRRVRRDANQAYNRAYLKYVNSLAATLGSSVKRDYFLMQARKYNSCLEASLDNNNIPTSVFHKLIEAGNANLEPLHKWAKIRKRILGIDTLYTYDLWASLQKEKKKQYTYEQAREMVLKGLQPLGKQYNADFAKGLDGGWVDVYETQGKGSGAYQWGTYSSHPYLLMNFNGTLESVFTLAHEMGHAMNSYYTKQNEPYISSGHSLFTAEVASTCNEAILMKYLLANTKDKAEKKELLIQYIEQIIGTFYTQLMFSEFELAIHDRVEQGGAISADFLRKTYRDIYQKYWGPDLVIDSVNDLGGMRISHFYRQYYVYQYATCYAAAQALSQGIMDKKPGALEKYQQFLKTGDSKYPVDILRDAGVDMTTPDPVNATIKIFGELVDQMEKLLAES